MIERTRDNTRRCLERALVLNQEKEKKSRKLSRLGDLVSHSPGAGLADTTETARVVCDGWKCFGLGVSTADGQGWGVRQPAYAMAGSSVVEVGHGCDGGFWRLSVNHW